MQFTTRPRQRIFSYLGKGMSKSSSSFVANEILLDCDGVLWRGQNQIENSIKALHLLRDMNKQIRFITNHSGKTRKQVVDKLNTLGFPTDIENVITAASITAHYVKHNKETSIQSVFMVGSDSLKFELELQGLRVISDPTASQKSFSESDFNDYILDPSVGAVVVGWDTSLTFRKIAIASMYLQSGCPFVLANEDPYDRLGNFNIPGTGSIAAAIKTASGKTPIVCGKPSQILIDYLTSHAQIEAKDPPKSGINSPLINASAIPLSKQYIMIGDRLDTDITFANKANFQSCLVLTGVSSMDTVTLLEDNISKLESNASAHTIEELAMLRLQRPTFVAQSLWDFVRQLS